MSATPFARKSGAAVQSPADEFEVLPPEGKRGSASSSSAAGGPTGIPKTKEEAISRLIAYLMDNLVKVPGTKARVGLNPFLDLLPVVGDGAAMFISAATILEGARRRVPKVVLTQMAANVLLNGLIGTIPGVGEVFAFWFKPSSRNYQLLVRHTPDAGTRARATTWREWAFVLGLIAAIMIVLGAFFAIGVFIIHAIYVALVHPMVVRPG